MKKLITLTLAAIMLFALASCGQPESQTTTTPSASTGAPSESVPASAPPSSASTPAGTPDPVQSGQPEVFAPVDITVNFDNSSLSALDPHLSSGTNLQKLNMVFGALMEIDRNTLKPVPWLAESVNVSDDGTVYTFVLHEGMQFHHGYGEVTAEDVVFSLSRSRDHEQSFFEADFANVVSFEAVDTYTVEITLAEADPFFLFTLSDQRQGSCIASKKAWDEVGDEGFAEMAYGSGPFYYDGEWVAQQSVRFLSFEQYFKGAPKVNVTVSEIKDGNTTLLALQSGDIQCLMTSQLEVIEQAKGLGMTVDSFNGFSGFGIFFNGNNYEPLKDVRIRQAIAHAIDKENNVAAVFGGELARVAPGFLPDNLPGYSLEGVTTYEYDPDRARELIADAGYAPGEIKISTIAQNNVRNERLFTLFQAQLAEVGIELEVTLASTSEYYATLLEYTVAFSYYAMPSMPEMIFPLLNYWLGGATNNYAEYDGVDELIRQASKTADESERNAIYAQIHAQISQDIPWLMHHYSNLTWAMRPELKGVYSKGAYGSNLHFDEAYIEQ